MESLMKYVPFVDFLLKIDEEKYYKFAKIKKWILSKKPYSTAVLKKTEDAVLMQYKNLLLENKVKIPQNITDTFAPSIDLCSDDEEQDNQNENADKFCNNNSVTEQEKNKRSNTRPDNITPNLDNDGDLEFVRIDYVKAEEKKYDKQPVEETRRCEEECDIDEISRDILNKIDQIAAEDLKLKGLAYEPINYKFEMECEVSDSAENDQEDIFQRREPRTDVLFKRRADFTADEVLVESLNDKDELLLSSDKYLVTITLDSDSENEANNGDEHPSNSNTGNSSNSPKPETETAVTDSNSNGSSSSKNNEKLQLLCKSIESVLPEMSDILNEIEEVENVTTSPVVVEESDKENTLEESTSGTPNIDPEQVSKILEDISSKTDFEMDLFFEALQYVKQVNLDQREIAETPPPAPPPIPVSAEAPPLPSSCEQESPQMTQPMTTYNTSNVNIVPTLPAPKPKLNVNDPRIKKHLQVIKNSPLFSYNLLNNDLEGSIRKMCHETVMQPSILNLKNDSTCSSVAKTSVTSKTKSAITYGEYKRRQLEKKLEMERKKEEERLAKAKAQFEREQREKLEQDKRKEIQDIRSQLISTLDPCKERLYSLWKEQCKPNEKPQKVNQENKEKGNIQTKQFSNAKELNSIATSETSYEQSKSKQNSEKKLNRIYSELKCTVKGFDKIQDYIVEETNIGSNEMPSCTNSSSPIEEASTSRLIGLRRRSSMHALSAITEQLGLESDCSDSELSENTTSKRGKNWSHDSSSESLSNDSLCFLPKRRKTIDEGIIKPSKKTKVWQVVDDETSSSASEVETHRNSTERLFTKVPIIKLHRISSEFIRTHSKRSRKDSANIPGGNAGESVRLKKTNEIVKSLQEPSQKLPKLKKYNNDCQMTERNTVFCVLCRSKPWDLTNHYKGRHKIESYVSRLDWSDLEDLAVNTHFATRVPKTKNCRFERYEVECPFCKEKIIDQFVNLYNHYSVHTGEYAFQCSHCSLAKPYKPDIQSHILHSKTCRNSSIQVMYRYPPQAQCIYLNYCNICNFVQLNEANVLKHLREHHDYSKAVESNVQKCILAAISDGPDACQTMKSISPLLTTEANINEDLDVDMQPSIKQAEVIDTSTSSQPKFEVDDDDIPVSNEPCLEEEFLDGESNTGNEVSSYMHEERDDSLQPMTVVHNLGRNLHRNANQMRSSQSSQQPTPAEIHQPFIIKSEVLENDKNPKLTTSSCSQQNQPEVRIANMVYEKYRSYPPNANYLGLYKCMIDDCFFSTDCISDITTHLTEHSTDALTPNQYLQCPYCIFISNTAITPTQLVDHVRTQHGHLKFQCSLCCYRSCDASNVNLHQQLHHSRVLNTCKIYKAAIDDSNRDSEENLNLNEKIEKNIFKISCKICGNASFYHTQLLINHLYNEHNLTSGNSLHIYSCINCPFTVDNKNQLKIHVATKHPGERPLIYDHNAPVSNINEDSKSCSSLVDISEPVPYIETEATAAGSEESTSQDIKPDVEGLLLMNEETVKVRLRKLTAQTGVSPDNLYRCPEQSCGGFFSNFELWIRHMKIRHITFECQCPHCPTTVVLPLEEFATHFEKHRRHTYICFYCSITSPTETLARKHAAQKHSVFRQMRFEKIIFNISYSYWIMIQRELFQEREQFIFEFLTVLDERLDELERNEIKNLKQQWPIRDNSPWYDDYLQHLPNRKVARRCLVKDCNYRTLKEENLYRHLSTSHTIAGTQFNCSKCDYHVERCNNLDEVFNHIKLHNEHHFICSVCTLVTPSRAKVTAHIQEQHTARDVPVVHIFRIGDQLYHKMYIVFADDNITFSTMRNCFCCTEKGMSGDVLNLHLKRYHNLTLTYHCEKCTNFPFKSLKEVKPHFEQFHGSGKLKLRCELAGRTDLQVLSLDTFQVEIVNPLPVSQQSLPSITVKNEPLDISDNDNVVLIEDDDVLIEHSLKAAQHKQADLPKLKCASFSKLLEPTINAATSSHNQHVKIPTHSTFSNLVKPNNNMSIRAPSALLQTPMLMRPTLPMTSAASTQSYYNLGQQNFNNTNPLMNTVNDLNQIPAALMQNDNSFVIFNRTTIRPVVPTHNSTLTQVRSLPLNVNNQNSICNNYSNRQYTHQAGNNSHIVQPNNAQIANPTNPPYLTTPQNFEYNTFSTANSSKNRLVIVTENNSNTRI